MDGQVEFYNKIYSENSDVWSQEWRDLFAWYAISRHIEQPESLLDIGCGVGHTIEYLSEKWPDTEFTGIDLSDVAIEVAKEKVPGADFIAGDYQVRQWKMFDVVVLMGVIEHFKDLVKALWELKEFGKLIYLEAPNCLDYSDDKKEGFRETDEGSGQLEWHLTRRSWEERIAFAGLEIVESLPGLSLPTEFVWVLK